MSTCTNCGCVGTCSADNMWWNCNNYYGISGIFCPECYSLIGHDSYRNPNHPEEYLVILMKLSGGNYGLLE